MMKSGTSALLSTVSFRTLAITGTALASLTVLGACDSVRSFDSAGSQPAAVANPYNPCAAANPCNPCAASPCNPCAAKNPCAAENPCAAKKAG